LIEVEKIFLPESRVAEKECREKYANIVTESIRIA
jgi:hypothetical protein